jgi:microcystin-dependent protein
MTGKFQAFEQGTDPDWSKLYQFIGAANGHSKWGKVWTLTSLNDDTNYEMTVRNLGTSGGGRHFQALHSATGAPVVQITDAGIALTGTISGLAPGIMAPWAGTGAPAKWLTCNGAAVSRTTYALLFAAIGVTWGAGDGSTTFNVPDLRGRVAVGTDGSHTLGTTGGATTVNSSHTHTGPSHTHTGPSHTHTINDHSHGLVAHNHGAGGYQTTGSVQSNASGEATNTVHDGGGSATNVNPTNHTHITPAPWSVAGTSGDGHNTSGGADFNVTQDKTSMATNSAGTGATGADGTGSTGSGGSTTLSIEQSYAVATWIIYAAV